MAIEQINLPWKNEKEFYNLHSKEIFSKYKMYHFGFIGKNDNEFLNHIVKKTKITTNSKVLDLGCGSGFIVNALSHFCKSKGISTSEECIKQAKINYPENDFEIANMETFKFKATTILALESLCYSEIKKTIKISYENLENGGILYIKELCIKKYESFEEKENRKHWEFYWKCKGSKIFEIIKIANDVGFELIEFNNLSSQVNNSNFIDTLKINKIKYIPPYPEAKFLITAEFIFKKSLN